MAVQHKGDSLTKLLLTSGADVKLVDDNQQTALHHAARTGGDVGCLEMLLQSWSDATATGPQSAGTANTGGGASAHEDANTEACRQLDKWGRTPLHWATVNGHRSAVVALVEAGSDMWLKDFQRDSSMDLAERRAECREWLNGQDGVRCDKLTLSMLQLMAT